MRCKAANWEREKKMGGGYGKHKERIKHVQGPNCTKANKSLDHDSEK